MLVNGMSVLMHLLALQVPYPAAVRYRDTAGRTLDNGAAYDFGSSVTQSALYK